MKHQQIKPAAMGWAEKADAALGRSDWVWADYVEAGRAEFDRIALRGESYRGERNHYARCFAELNCPASKRVSRSIPQITEPSHEVA